MKLNKKEFLKALERELINLEENGITNIIEYYDELIEDQIENGEKEKDVIADMSIYEIVKEVKASKKINEAAKKPSLSNGMKALIAFLGILSFPLLITVGVLTFVILVTIIAIIFSFIVTLGTLALAGIASFVVFFLGMILGTIPIATGLFGIGVSFIITGLMIILVKWGASISRDMLAWFTKLIKAKYKKYKGDDSYE
jgi:uncharacterized membrane protein